MKKLSFFVILLISFSSNAKCLDLSGSYQLDTAQCSIIQTDGNLMVYSDFPMLNLMGIPGPKYGYLLRSITTVEDEILEIHQQSCDSIQITSHSNSNASLHIAKGIFPYFGARSRVLVSTKLDEQGITQEMLMTKYTTIADGVHTIYKDLQYTSHLKQDDNGNLLAKTLISYGEDREKTEAVSCTLAPL